MASITKQFHHLLRTIEKFSNGQASVPPESLEFDELTEFCVVIAPTGGLYRGGKFTFRFYELPESFEEEAPKIECITPIYHPNIDCEDQTICLNVLDEDWDSTMSLEDIVHALLFLLYNPNPDDPLSPIYEFGDSSEEFCLKVRRSLRGGEHFGIDFPANLDPAYEDDEVAALERAEAEDLSNDLGNSDEVEAKSGGAAPTEETEDVSAACGGSGEANRTTSVIERTKCSSVDSAVTRSELAPPYVALKSVGRHLAHAVRLAAEMYSIYHDFG